MNRNFSQFFEDLKGVVQVGPEGLKVLDPQQVRERVDAWVYTYVFSPIPELKEACRYLIRETARVQGIFPASIHEFYIGRGQGEYHGFTVPAVNIRGMTYDVARRFFRLARDLEVGALIFEIARSEIGYTMQSPDEYATVILAAALKEGVTGPIFIQGDHFQIKKAAYDKNSDLEIQALEQLIEEALAAGFYNIDIDASTLVDLSKPDLKEQQEWNAEWTAHFTRFIRKRQPEGITVSIGGEIGEVGGRNSTPEDLEAFMTVYLQKIEGLPGISKVSVQTGTHHGGVVLPDGTLAQVKVDFQTLETLSRLAREKYGMAGAVQHGASTLPIDAFSLFPKTETAEIHLATQFQNILYDSPELPEDFKATIYDFLKREFAQERKPEDSEAQFIYKTRKKGFGPFKWEWWTLSEDIKEPMLERLEPFIQTLFEALRVVGTKALVEKKTPKVEITLEIPEVLKEFSHG